MVLVVSGGLTCGLVRVQIFAPWHENGTVQVYSNIQWEGGSLFHVRQVVGVTAVVRG